MGWRLRVALLYPAAVPKVNVCKQGDKLWFWQDLGFNLNQIRLMRLFDRVEFYINRKNARALTITPGRTAGGAGRRDSVNWKTRFAEHKTLLGA